MGTERVPWGVVDRFVLGRVRKGSRQAFRRIKRRKKESRVNGGAKYVPAVTGLRNGDREWLGQRKRHILRRKQKGERKKKGTHKRLAKTSKVGDGGLKQGWWTEKVRKEKKKSVNMDAHFLVQ